MTPLELLTGSDPDPVVMGTKELHGYKHGWKGFVPILRIHPSSFAKSLWTAQMVQYCSMQLTAVQLVLHSALTDTDAQALGAVISDFLVEHMTLDRACALCRTGSTSLLELVWYRGLRCIESPIWSVGKLVHAEPHYRQWVYSRALLEAVQRKEVLLFQWLLFQWLLDHFPSCTVTQQVGDKMMKSGLESWLGQAAKDEYRPQARKKLSLSAAAKAGQWERVHRLHERLLRLKEQPSLSRWPVHCAFVQNNTEELKWAVAQGYPIRTYLFPRYSKEKWQTSKDNARYLLELQHDTGLKANIVSSVLSQAVEADDLAFVQWLLSHQLLPREHIVRWSLKRASEHGNIPVVECLIDHMNSRKIGCGQRDAMFAAVEHRKLELAQWLYERYGRDPSGGVFCGAPRSLWHFGEYFSSTEMDVAAKSGHLDVLQFLHQINLSTQRNANIAIKRVKSKRETTRIVRFERWTVLLQMAIWR